MPYLHELVSPAVRDFADKYAVVYDDGMNIQTVTYGDLWQVVKEMSSHFCALHMTGQTVAVIQRQNLNTPAIVLGLLHSNCCYYPVNDDGGRFVADSIKKAGASWVIIESCLEKGFSSIYEQLKGCDVHSEVMCKFQMKLIQLNVDSHQANARDVQHLAYCITTSGTTGSPKVIRVPHSCIVPNIIDLRNIFQMNVRDKILLTAPLTFDLSIIDMFLALSVGGTLVIVPDIVKRNPQELIHILHTRQKVTILQATPSLIKQSPSQLLRQTIFGPNSSLRVIALGGEQFPSCAELTKWLDSTNETQFFNLYGITELSCWASCEYVDMQQKIKSDCIVSIGKPLSKSFIHIDVDEKSDSMENKNEGFIWLGSSERVCLVDSDESSNLPLPFDDENIVTLPQDSGIDTESETKKRKKIVWRNTGDIGKLLDDGRIVFLGRLDSQVKRHGKRMTLSALETVCCELPWISKCCALMRENDLLILFYIAETDKVQCDETENDNDTEMQKNCQQKPMPSDGVKLTHAEFVPFDKSRNKIWLDCDEVQTNSLRDHIRDALPSHYIPGEFVKMESFPLTTHGKLDKRKLLETEKTHTHMADICDRKSPVTWIKQLWLTHLPNDAIDIKMDDTFLSLGGDSLTAIGLINQIKKFLGEAADQLIDVLLNKSFSSFVKSLQNFLDENDKYQQRMAGSDVKFIEDSVIFTSSKQRQSEMEFHKYNLGGRERYDNSDTMSGEDGVRKPYQDTIQRHYERASQHFHEYDFSDQNKFLRMSRSCVISRGNRVSNVISNNSPMSTISFKNVSDNELGGNDNAESRKSSGSNLAGSYATKENGTRNGKDMDNNCQHKVSTDDHVSTMEDPVDRTENRKRKTRNFLTTLYDEDREIKHKPFFQLRWTFDTKKCVDASPVIAVYSESKAVVFIGSHSGHFSATDIISGQTIWTTVLPDRIESAACIDVSMSRVIVGSYNGIIYVLNATSGHIEWEFSTGDSVKGSPCLDAQNGHVMCGSHDGWLYTLDVQEKRCVWKHHLGGGSVYSSAVVDALSDLVYAASLNGKLVALTASIGTFVWVADLKKPLFSSPCLHGSSVLIGCVDGLLYCINNRGEKEWAFETQGPIFSSPISYQSFILFGSHDNHLYCLTSEGELAWKFETPSPVFASPFVFTHSCTNQDHLPKMNNENIKKKCRSAAASDSLELKGLDSCIQKNEIFVVTASTKGHLYVLDFNVGNVIASTDLTGEVFSSPVVHDGHAVIGCRNDFVYCYDFLP